MKKIIVGFLLLCSIVVANNRKAEVIVVTGENWKQKTPYLFKTIPTFAIWVEDVDGNFIETIYVTSKIANASWKGGKDVKRPEALPIWVEKRGELPTKEKPVVDGISGASPKKSSEIEVNIKTDLKHFVIRAEVNNSFDYNTIYGKKAKGETIDSGENGQPSLLYSKEVEYNEGVEVELDYLGYSKGIGSEVEVVQGKEGITSALDILDSLTIKF